jgi:CubicO group peptidase (beta-lactamase class C family)
MDGKKLRSFLAILFSLPSCAGPRRPATMKIVAILFALLLVVLFAVLYLKYRMDNTPDRNNLEAAIDAEVNKVMSRGQFPGVVVGVYRDGRTFIKGYGTVKKETMKRPDGTTIFQIGSLSKLLTASLLQVLCDEGVVSIEATLGELIGSSVPLSAAAQQVTLKQLVTHTSGFPRIPRSLHNKMTNMASKDDILLDPYSYLVPQFIFEYLSTTEDKREPGRFEYSNFGMGLLAHVLEVVTGRDYESLVTEKVLAPFGMNGTSITPTSEIKEHLAQGYTAKGTPTRPWTFAALAGAGAFYSNVQDMLMFIRANVEEDGAAAQLFQKMREPQFGGDSGIGWMQPTFFDRFFGNQQVVWHNGMVGGYASYLSIDAQSKSGVVILTNQASATEMLGMMLTRQARTQSWSSSSPSNQANEADTKSHAADQRT